MSELCSRARGERASCHDSPDAKTRETPKRVSIQRLQARGKETARDDVSRATERVARTTRVVSRTKRGVFQLRLQARGGEIARDDVSRATKRVARTTRVVSRTKRGVSQLRLQARGKETARDDVSRATKRVARTTHVVSRTKRGVSQLRRHAHGNTARSGLAGRSLPCKKGFGLALKRSDGERHHARGGVASKEARGAGGHTPRGGWEPGPIRRLDRGRYCDRERERERERDVSALLTHLPMGPTGRAAIPGTYVPIELTRKQLPHRKRFRSLSEKNPLLRCKVDH